jgi:hypothetical protein
MEYTLFFPADSSGYVEHPTIGGTTIVYRTVSL